MKIWKIKCCDECPKYGVFHKISGSYDYCHMSNKLIDKINELPDWCPLEDYKEGDKIAKNQYKSKR